MDYKPHGYQVHATGHVLRVPGAGLFLEMGLGKTVATLTAIVELMRRGEVTKTLVIAPKHVARDTWTREIAKWDHLRHLTVSVVLGTEKHRKEALRAKSDLYVVNVENVCWLIDYLGGAWPFQMTVIDELSKFKNPKSQRFRALRMVRPRMQRVVGLTGTPRPQGLLDLWSQLYLLDRGERLGPSIGKYREKYFNAVARQGHVVTKYALKQGDDLEGGDINEKEIYEKISDICISMSAKDYLNLPKRVDNDIVITFNDENLKKYKQFERDAVLELASAGEITAVNAAALTGKLLQYANGAIYDVDKQAHTVHDEKLDALETLIDSQNGAPVLVFYQFKHDLARVKQRFRGRVVELKTTADIRRWNRGEIEILVAHPASAGHGLNLQDGGNVIAWFGLPWSLELYQQANARLDRQGQQKPVFVYHLIAAGTMDEDVLKALTRKASGQQALMDAVKARINQYLHQKKSAA